LSCFGFISSQLPYRLSTPSPLSTLLHPYRSRTRQLHSPRTPTAQHVRPPATNGPTRRRSLRSVQACSFGYALSPPTTPRVCILTMRSQANPPSERCAITYPHDPRINTSNTWQSSLVLRFVKDQFDDYRESTIGAAFLTQTIALDDTTTVKFEIWDTAGQERYKSLAPMYYRNANCAVVVYDITQAVRSTPNFHLRPFTNTVHTGIPRQGKGLGQGAATSSQREHHHCPCRKQARSCHRGTRQARRLHRRCRTIRPRSRSALLRDLSKDGRERQGTLHRHRKEAPH
jgi:hypothetical protein